MKIKKILSKIDEFVSNIAENIKEDARDRVPVDSGDLRDSIDIIRFKNKYLIGSNLSYAFLVEYGTKNKEAQPYLRPSLLNKRNYK